jgi:hypothetical protein
MLVAKSPLSAPADSVFHAVRVQVDQQVHRFEVGYDGPDRYLDFHLGAVFAALVADRVLAVAGLELGLKLEVVQRALVAVGDENHVSAASAVGSVGAAARHVLFAVKPDGTASAPAAGKLHHGLVEKHEGESTWVIERRQGADGCP